MGFLAPFRSSSKESSTSSRGAGEEDRSYDLLDCMERGVSRELVADFMEPLPDCRKLWKFYVERSADRYQYRLYCEGDAFMMYARLERETCRINIYMYDPLEEDSKLFDASLPAFSMSCDGSRTHWSLCQHRCDCCRHAPEEFVCSCGGEQELMRAQYSSESVGDGLNHCLDVELPRHTLVTKLPVWNEDLNSLVLDFAGREVVPSAKNFQMRVDGDARCRTVCQYGKIDGDTFGLDFKAPLSVVEAFGLALATTFWV
jgi:hypothetical protein